MSDKIIYTTGFPRSGTWWITRLLSDLLDSPICTLPPDNVRVDKFCQTGEGGWTIYKTHLPADEWDGTGRVVFIQRDPRDVAVSAMYYCNDAPKDNDGLMDVIKTMVLKEPGVDFQTYHIDGAYRRWVWDWIEIRWAEKHRLLESIICTRYEWLHYDPFYTLQDIAWQLDSKRPDDNDVESIIKRNSFDKWKPHYPHAMRKGIVGDWRNHFKRAHGEFITEHLGQLMLDMGYVDGLDWWEELPE